LLKTPECKKCIQYNELGISIFQGKHSCSKVLNGKKYIQYSEKFQGNSAKGKRKLLKILNVKSIFNTVKILGQLCFFRASASCSKIGEKIFNSLYSLGADPCNLGQCSL